MSEMAPARAAAAADTGAPGPQDTYEIFAIRYGTVRRRAADNFMMAGAIAYSLVKHDLDGATDADGTTTSQPDRPAHRPDL